MDSDEYFQMRRNYYQEKRDHKLFHGDWSRTTLLERLQRLAFGKRLVAEVVVRALGWTMSPLSTPGMVLRAVWSLPDNTEWIGYNAVLASLERLQKGGPAGRVIIHPPDRTNDYKPAYELWNGPTRWAYPRDLPEALAVSAERLKRSDQQEADL